MSDKEMLEEAMELLRLAKRHIAPARDLWGEVYDLLKRYEARKTEYLDNFSIGSAVPIEQHAHADKNLGIGYKARQTEQEAQAERHTERCPHCDATDFNEDGDGWCRHCVMFHQPGRAVYCEYCKGTGYCGNTGPGIKFNDKYHRCYKCDTYKTAQTLFDMDGTIISHRDQRIPKGQQERSDQPTERKPSEAKRPIETLYCDSADDHYDIVNKGNSTNYAMS